MSQAPRIANLPWYDFPEIREATDTLWSAVAVELTAGGLHQTPRTLDRETPYLDTWHSPRFLMGQACGYDLVISARKHLQYVATPCYTAPCSRGANYRSYVVVREEDPWQSLHELRGLRCVINQRTSHSGMNTLRCELAPASRDGHFFAAVLESGSHRRSLRDLREQKADVAAIDCVAFALLRKACPEDVAGLRIIHRTAPVPAPPYVTSSQTPPEVVGQLRQALARALAQPAVAPVRETLMLDSVLVLPASQYSVIQQQKEVADRAGYTELLSPPEL